MRTALTLLRLALLTTLASLIPSTVVMAQEDAASTARRIAAMVSIAAEEYALGVSDGRVVSEAELEEARQFLAEAERLVETLPTQVASPVQRELATLAAAVRVLAGADVLRRASDSVRVLLATSLEISLDPMPSAPPRLARGAGIYAASCAGCHGTSGAGDGPAAAGLDPPPTAFTDRGFLAETTPLEFFRKVSVGVAGTAMVGFEDALSVDERWAVSLYVSGLRYTDAERAGGRRWLAARCPDCLVALSDPTAHLAVNDDSLATIVAVQVGASPPTDAVAFARTAGAGDVLGLDPALAARRTVRAADGLIEEAIALARGGERTAAVGKSLEAYLAFEAIEISVGARSAGAVTRVERAFETLRGALASGNAAGMADAAGTARAALDDAAAVLADGGNPVALFGQSLLIILREGLEALLIVGALTALLVKSGVPERRRDLAIGVGLAIGASLASAVVFATVLRVSLAQQEAIEGITMLLASVVLVGVASWMVSKIEAEKWKTFVTAKVTEALRSRRAWALAGVAFLAVYREGVETVLFYAALSGTAETGEGYTAVAAGFALGVAVLAVLYLAMQRWGVRIPIRPFFAVTGMLLTIMAVSFAGQGVAELQTAGWVPATPIRLPALPPLGVFPTLQTLGAQLVMALVFGLTVLWMLRSPRPVSVGRES